MSRLRWKLLAAMIALVVITIGTSALLTRRVTRDQVQRLLVTRRTGPSAATIRPIEQHMRARGLEDVVPVLDRVGAAAHYRIVLADSQRKVVAKSRDLDPWTIALEGAERLTLSRTRGGQVERLVLRVRPIAIRDAAGRQLGSAYCLPSGEPQDRLMLREIAATDRRLLTIFLIATAVALLMTFVISRRITRPIEELTRAVHGVGRGEMTARVNVSGRDEIAQLATSFNGMADAIATQQELRRRLVSDVAHELRTPLTNLRCELEAIQDGLTTPDPPRIASIHEEVLHLQRLVDDLQELAVADAGALPLHRETLDLNTIVARAAGSAEVALHAEPLLVHVDPTRIRQIVQNLLANALHHSSDDARIHVRVTRNGSDAIVSVRDDGPGIAAEHLERIFERFYRVDEARGRESGGAGLGLAIVRRLVELHGGRVWAESMPGEGATFTFTIPLARS